MTNISSLCVFCGSRKGADAALELQASHLGSLMAERNIELIYGGGGIGLMGVIATSVLENGGRVTGVIPDFLMKLEVGDPGVSELIQVGSMHERKQCMFEKSDGFIIMPGGLGTLDETFEILTWKQLQQHRKPVVIANINGYWDPFLSLIDSVIDGGFGHHKVRELYSVVSQVDQIFTALENAPEPDIEVLTSHL